MEKQTPKKEKAVDDEKDLDQLQTEEIGGEETDEDDEDLDASDTDDDEDEGVGDGNLGKTTPDLLDK